MAATQPEPKPSAVEVTLADGREVTLREPQAIEYVRLFGAQLIVGKMHNGAELSEADEATVRHAICLLSVTPDGPLTEDDMLALSAADFARLFIGLLRIMAEPNSAPLVTPSDSASPTSSSATAPAKARRSPTGRAA